LSIPAIPVSADGNTREGKSFRSFKEYLVDGVKPLTARAAKPEGVQLAFRGIADLAD
jgi:hypothetical protein